MKIIFLNRRKTQRISHGITKLIENLFRNKNKSEYFQNYLPRILILSEYCSF